MAEPRKRPVREILEALIIAALFLRFANTFVLQTFYIPSKSMTETLLVGDHLFVNRFIYGPTLGSVDRAVLPHRDLRRGDIVIFRSPKELTLDVVKRCVGLPGDRIEVRKKALYINGKAVDDSAYAIHTDPVTYPDIAQFPLTSRVRDNFGPYVVPEGHYFCMGDNRDQSYDSRFWGPLPRELVKGRAFMIYWSNAGETPDGSVQTYGEMLAHMGKTLVGLPFNTRWGRTFQVIR